MAEAKGLNCTTLSSACTGRRWSFSGRRTYCQRRECVAAPLTRPQWLLRNSKCRPSCPTVAKAIQSSSVANWETFSRSASGEWEGSSASFDLDGEPIPLPSQYVPDAYREWGQEIHDWQTQCSTLAEDGSIKRIVKRLMPTVGCEADAVAYNEEEKANSLGSQNKQHAQFADDGSYTIPAELKGADRSRAYAEHCFVIAEGRRIRVIQQLQLRESWELSAVEVFNERWEADYNGGKELAGCGGGVPGFSGSEKTDPAAISTFAQAQGQEVKQLLNLFSPKRGEDLYLPLNAWSKISEQGDDLVIMAGVLLGKETVYLSVHTHHQRSTTPSISLRRLDKTAS